MLAVERQIKIREFLNEYKHTDVATLSVLLSVSEVTIRKDLEKLEKLGVIHRMHGGAVLIEADNEDRFSVDDDPCLIEKQEIAELANQLIDDNDIVFIGPGTTCLLIAKKISESGKYVRMITNNCNLLSKLNNSKLDLISTGGTIVHNGRYSYLGGDLSSLILDNILVNKVIIAVDGVSMTHGFTVINMELRAYYERLAAKADKLIIAADVSKFDKASMVPFRRIDDVQCVVTNETIPSHYKDLFYDRGIQLFTTVSVMENLGK